MKPEMARQRKALEKEKSRLKKMVAHRPGHGDPHGGSQEKLVSPERRRRTVSAVRIGLGAERVSERRACRVLGQPRNTQ